MTLYNIIYDFFDTYVFTANDMPECTWQIGGEDVAFASWLNHTATIAVLVLMVLVAVRFAVWLTRTIGNAMRLA